MALTGATLFALCDAEPPPADWAYSFPTAAIDAHRDVADAWLPDGKFHTRFGVFALVDGVRITLVDTGVGPGPHAYFPGLAGRLLAEMEDAGLDPAAVDTVLFTHFHLDHVGWACGGDGRPTFPKARYLAPAAELAHWQSEGRQAALPHHVAAYERCIAPLVVSGRLETAESGEALLAPGLSFVAAPGHTKGHHAVLVEGRGRPVLIAGDLWHSPAQIAVPAWCHRADRDQPRAIESRTRLAGWAAEAGAIVAAGHFPHDRVFGTIMRATGGGLTFAPLRGSAPAG
ncbi:MBL fold metallo-hydrolase [Limobrevibacterium gyesilva]|uniref:MBL fold metallo-hydrolase n=1 Tax=Limobrevibacterium gyesilva TaxID=2991712 RepID=A0AA41YJS9_9PROT|nr:MBL fold metallo-hydrolase [Limobrevibacterium gyesilva]MCW3475011.1 MBL fold metallo-hydrolase [Limobrevibacterium gyesilva]